MLSIEHILPRARRLYGNRKAIASGETWLSFEAVAERVEALHAALAGLGLRPGDRVAMLDFNSAPYLEVSYASVEGQFIFVPLNARLSAPELAYCLKDSGAAVLVTCGRFAELVSEVRRDLPSLRHVIGYDAHRPDMADYEELVVEYRSKPVPHRAPSLASDVAQIYYTSGTTGEPKGVCLTYQNMTTSAYDAVLSLGLSWSDCWLHAAPLFHLVDAWATWAFPLLGAPQVAQHFSAETFPGTIERWGVTATALPPTLISLVCEGDALEKEDISSLRLIMYGGSPMPAGTLQRARSRLPVSYYHSYGTTETSGITTILRAEDLETALKEQSPVVQSAGHPVPGVRLAIFDDDGREMSDGVVGEIVMAGPRVMSEYWHKPVATNDAFYGEYYRSGDLGYINGGFVYVVDRKKDMIISGGENVYPAEIESILSTHAAVLECAVIGIPSEKWGEQVHAFVVVRPGCLIDDRELLAFCRGKIANYKIPKSFEFRLDPLPKAGAGKIMKRALKDSLVAADKRKVVRN